MTGLAKIIGLLLLLLVPLFPAFAEDPGLAIEVGIDEQLDSMVMLDVTFRDESGELVQLRDLIDKPTIVSLVYYRCPAICKPLLSGVAEVLDRIEMEPGEDYQVITISFDEKDKPEDSGRMKKNYLTGMGKSFPEGTWRFLTGDSVNIMKFTSSAGFRFKRNGEDFVHPAALIILTPQGKIARYLYGIKYLPFDLKLAITEASEGRVGPTITKVLLYCFSYDTEGKRYVLNVTRIAGVGVLLVALTFISFLVITGRKHRKSQQ